MSQSLTTAVTQLVGSSLTTGNDVQILRNGNEIFPAMLEAIDAAERSIEFCTYVYWKGKIAERFADSLIAAADSGVAVRIVLDAYGTLRMSPSIRRRLENSDCRVCHFRPFHWWLPFNNHRTHRKLLICDNRIGFTGGVGIADQWLGDAATPKEWRETHFRIMGNLVTDLRAAFLDNWLEVFPTDLPEDPCGETNDENPGTTQAGLVTSTANNRWSRVATLLHGIIGRAETSLDICSPYFVPDRKITRMLLAAVQRDVQVRILTASSRHSDSILSYLAGARFVTPLIKGGVEIYQYQPTFLHAKVLLGDGTVAVAGSSNLNQRSLKKDDEASFVCIDQDVCAALTDQFEADLDKSRPITLKRFRGRSWTARVGEILIRPFSESV